MGATYTQCQENLSRQVHEQLAFKEVKGAQEEIPGAVPAERESIYYVWIYEDFFKKLRTNPNLEGMPRKYQAYLLHLNT